MKNSKGVNIKLVIAFFLGMVLQENLNEELLEELSESYNCEFRFVGNSGYCLVAYEFSY